MRIVVKYGGNAMAGPDAEDPLLDDLAARARAGDAIVLVHGGGPQIDAALAERGIESERVAGLRITDATTLAVTESVLCGTVNKSLVRAFARRGIRAAGISGEDGALLEAVPAAAVEGRSLGFVGEIARVDRAVLDALLDAGFLPVVAPLALSRDASAAYNVNADTAAGAIAGALRADAYIVITNVERVRSDLNDPASGLAELSHARAQAGLDDGTFGGGMKPKMESALEALRAGARCAIICGSGAGALGRALRGESGTRIVGEALN